jgi:hypothetical protein
MPSRPASFSRQETTIRETAAVTGTNQITERLTVDSPSDDLFDQLPLRQLVVFVARAHQRPLTQLADLLGLSRETIHPQFRVGDPNAVRAHSGPSAARGSSRPTRRTTTFVVCAPS